MPRGFYSRKQFKWIRNIFSSGAHSFANYFIILGYSKENVKGVKKKKKQFSNRILNVPPK